ncbi:MAG: heparinase II/III family protein [Tepidisphaeraceae bacterium]
MRDIPYWHQLETTDEQFLDHLRLPGPAPAGQRLARARQAGDLGLARQLVAAHFRRRRSPAWSFYSHGSPWHQTDAAGSVLEKADNLLTHRFRNAWPPHQWMDLGDGSADPLWCKGLEQARTSVSRGTWVSELSTAFALTGDAKYAAKAMQLMRSFVTAHPFILDPRFVEDHDTYFGGDADSTQLTSHRLFRWTDFLHSGAVHTPGAGSDDDVFWLIKQIWFYAMQFARLLGDDLRRDNHHLLDHGHLPFVIGLAFPEFSISDEFVREGSRVIRHHFGHNLLKDGAYAEHSTNYQYHVLFHFTHPHGVAKANGCKLFTDAQVKLMRKWVEFSARCGKPNGVLPGIGDEPGRPLHHLFGSLATPVMDKHLAAMARGLGCVPGSHQIASAADVSRAMKKWKLGERLTFGLSEYYTAPPRRPDPRQLPTPATCQYPIGGYTFFRSAWSPDADYLAVSHFRGDYGGHCHWDPMAFTLHTQGKTLIGDPAAWLYVDRRFHGHGGLRRAQSSRDQCKDRAELALPYRGYSYSVNAHNCLVMNDDTLKPLEAMNHGTFWGGWPHQHGLGVFEAGGPIEVAEVWNDANAPTRHRRFFVHVVGIGFILVDLLSKRPNLAPHQYAQSFHFEGNVQIAPHAPENGHALRALDGDAACLIVPGADTESRWRTFRDPYLDDVYGVPNTNGAPWIAELTRRVRGQAVFTHFILTRDAARNAHARARYLGPKPSAWLAWQHDGLSANAIELGEQGSLLVASAPYRRKLESPELMTDAELAVVHLDARGKAKSWIMLRGTRLASGRKRLATGKKVEFRAKSS